MEHLKSLNRRLPDDHLRRLLEDTQLYDGEDPLQPWIRCLDWATNSLPLEGFEHTYRDLFERCIGKFSGMKNYNSDERYIRIWVQYADCFHSEADIIFARMNAEGVGENSSLFYGAYAIYLEISGKFGKANDMYNLGISRQAKPLHLLNDAYKSFLKRMASRYQSQLIKATRNIDGVSTQGQSGKFELGSISGNTPQIRENVQALHPFADLSNKEDTPRNIAPTKCGDSKMWSPVKFGNKVEIRESQLQVKHRDNGIDSSRVNPWETHVIENLLSTLKPPLSQYKGFHCSKHNYTGPALVSLRSAPHNKILELGSRRYHLKGCTGQGAFAQIFKACDDQDKDKIVALKVQKPPWPWEYYIYSQLDKRIPEEERASFGRAWRMNIYKDCSIMVCAYGELGTLQDVVNSYLATGQRMDELLCMYYTVEMLRMLDVLHSAGLIHGDFKPDNLLIRNESEILEDWAPCRPGQWKYQGLCLIDWGRSIDLKLFPRGTLLDGDCKTSGFRCIEMQEHRPWTYQVDTYGLCCIVHIMLHGSYMEIEVTHNSENKKVFRPKVPLKRYHKQEIWGELFSTLLNVEDCRGNPSLGRLRTIFENYLMSDSQHPKKIRELMVRQRRIMCSRT